LKRTRPPFRADHVGSLLRPARLSAARASHADGHIGGEGLRAVEDECIREVVRLQEDLGFQAVTDGEFRRGFYHVDFLARLEGVSASRNSHRVRYQGRRKHVEYDVPVPTVIGKLRRRSSLAVEEFGFLRSVTSGTAKVCIPAPSMLHFQSGRQAVDHAAYPRIADFFEDLAGVYREELAALYAAGCRYLQIDDPNIAFLCDPHHRERVGSLGEDPEALPGLYAELIQASIRDRPADMSVCVHLCRGNFSRTGAARGGYEPVAEAVFSRIRADGFFLEFDDERSGDFAPLRFAGSNGALIVLGLVSTKRPELERREALLPRVEQAAKHVGIERLAISPQCGFSSTHHGTDLTPEEQAAKLRLVIEIAREVWG
jgi:5-methyltetrahydropteroyltriglutamate--homocysteine methyltransferase